MPTCVSTFVRPGMDFNAARNCSSWNHGKGWERVGKGGRREGGGGVSVSGWHDAQFDFQTWTLPARISPP